MKHASNRLRSHVLIALLAALAAGTVGCDKKEAAGAAAETTSVDVKTVFSDPKTAQLATAAAAGDAAKVAALVQAGANPSATGDKGTSLLQWAMLNKSKAGMQALLTAGADTTHTDAAGDTIMLYAAKANDSEYLDMLLAQKVDITKANPVTGQTPLIASIFGERDVQFHKLLAAGANPNQTDRLGNTPLHVAAKINQNQFVLDLLNAGADPTARNRQGHTFQLYMNMTPANALTADARAKRENVVAWLRAHKVPVEDAQGKPG